MHGTDYSGALPRLELWGILLLFQTGLEQSLAELQEDIFQSSSCGLGVGVLELTCFSLVKHELFSCPEKAWWPMTKSPLLIISIIKQCQDE